MLRRVYLLFPGRKFAERAVVDLTGMGVARRHIHTIARQDVDIEGLPEASVRQRSDFAARLEQWFWDLNLLLFFAALLVLVAAAFSGSVGVTPGGTAGDGVDLSGGPPLCAPSASRPSR